MSRHQPRSTLFPYTTLFGSQCCASKEIYIWCTWERVVSLITEKTKKKEQMLKPASLQKDRKSTRLNSSHTVISYAVFCLKKKNLDYSIRLCKLNDINYKKQY